MNRLLILLLSLFTSFSAIAQKEEQASSSTIFSQMKKLNVLGNVLYLAAHPDDENTRFIAYSSNEKMFNTSYMSLTRGSGGQNLIGPEIRDALGIIRTQELLAARRIDGGKQFFSRANDFGYSKTSEETMDIWDEEKVMADIVWVIRKLRPDVIVLRFPPDSRGGHGHHSASAIMGLEAFDLAADKNAFPEQLKYVKTWQAKRIVVNTGRWWDPDISANDPGVVSEDIGQYSAILGVSMNEISADSRSQHKSQGFGTAPTRGEQFEYFEHQKGNEAKESLFENIDFTWNRVEDSKNIQKIITKLLKNYDVSQPEKSIPQLINLRNELQKIKDSFWKEVKTEEVDALIKQCAGLFLEAQAVNFSSTQSDSIHVTIEILNRSNSTIIVQSIASNELNINKKTNLSLNKNSASTFTDRYYIGDLPFTQPYWLAQKGTFGMYNVDDLEMNTKDESDPSILFTTALLIEGETIEYTFPLIFKSNDPVKGETYRPFIITPPVSIGFNEGIHLFPSQEAQEISFVVKAEKDNFTGKLQLEVPQGWQLSQSKWNIVMKSKGEEQTLKVKVTPSKNSVNGTLNASITTDGQRYASTIKTIEYDHIPAQVYLPNAMTQLVFIDLKKTDRKIGYIEGAGDVVMQTLKTIGYEVDVLTESDITTEKIQEYNTIILGIRALNTNVRIGYQMPALLAFVKSGGTLLLQYNTSHRLKTENFSPYPLTLSRDRVTEEDAEVTFLLPEHPALNTPNKMTKADFEGWVQERGLYFPNQWDEHYESILSWHDKNETPKAGGLLVAKYGKGYYVYTGISFFRELPAGVPGAFRLLVNLISLDQNNE